MESVLFTLVTVSNLSNLSSNPKVTLSPLPSGKEIRMNPRERDVFEVLVAMIVGGSLGLVLLHAYQVFG